MQIQVSGLLWDVGSGVHAPLYIQRYI